MGSKPLSEVTAGLVTECRIDRIERTKERKGKLPARDTIHQEILPDLSEPHKKNGKISHRAWFSPEEYQKLYTATRRRTKKPLNNKYKWETAQLHDLVLFMANTGMRPDENTTLEVLRYYRCG
jgi:integrase